MNEPKEGIRTGKVSQIYGEEAILVELDKPNQLGAENIGILEKINNTLFGDAIFLEVQVLDVKRFNEDDKVKITVAVEILEKAPQKGEENESENTQV